MGSGKLEIIISEDGSTDATLPVAFSLQRRYPDMIRVIYANANVGLIKNFCRVFDFCRGRYIAYTDGDDYFCDRRKIQKQVAYLHSNPDVAMIYTGAAYQVGRHRLFRARLTKRTSERLMRMNNHSVKDFALSLFRKDPITANTPMFKHEVMSEAVQKIKGLFNLVEWFPCQDFEAYFYIATLGKVRFIADTTAVHRIYGESQSGTCNDLIAVARYLGDLRVKLAMIEQDCDYFPDSVKVWAVIGFISRLLQYLALTNQHSLLTPYVKGVATAFRDKLSRNMVRFLDVGDGALAHEFIRERSCEKKRQTLIYYVFKAIALNVLRM